MRSKFFLLAAVSAVFAVTNSASAMNVGWNSSQGRYEVNGGSLDSEMHIGKGDLSDGFFYSGADELHSTTTGVRCGSIWGIGHHVDEISASIGATDVVTCQGDRDVLASLGGGNDTLVDISEEFIDYIVQGGTGTDTITTADGDDTIDVADGRGERDVVSCGAGFDRVTADSDDVISSNCNSVTR